MRRLTIGVLGGALALSACAGSDTTSTDDTPPPVTEAPAAAEEPAAESTAPPATTAAPAAEAEPTPTDPPSEEAVEPAPEPEPTTSLAPEPEPAPVGGRELGEQLRPESATANNPFPDLLVDDVRRGTKANLANLIPAERPLLVWAWAPH